ncbi:type I-B CRISPR-associated protein Cas5 [Clostridium botulinum]|uniref:CRISPR-associated protein Cas5 n=1 Tax=Clostridium botulinum TaxID=1491 RepID=A0A126JI62_CLOBO|nr:type I-B CRISPR-associated protein Cas5b [Clostridium botulinum]ALT05352.1 CRISPR-associated protein Cas5 [Clostridium botulinum]MCS6112650.1 type I-B CRISPR-associated protein Cas5 [Clostridium botulinum]NFF88451.1 type I-B CRISPR-associated protein Cas5 [Clostridium botulinum]NFG11397.1 type I-B CRISPR-associated protein Cas5 [Clostridium botulinum]NFH90544.1 type I-B CRISPR-associated protein Cas5 [Clostridium botulinum]
MRILSFNLKGDTAFFRTNSVNDADITYSYGHIHKVALLGMLGAILGLQGHNIAYMLYEDKYKYPEFYKVLKDIKIAIKPNAKKGSFTRKKQNMTNGCGCIKKGDTLMYTEQWLYKVNWDIFIDLDSIDKEISKILEDYILNSKAVYMPYLGKTNHPAVITNAKVVMGENQNEREINIDSLFLLEDKSIKINNTINPFDMNNMNRYEYRELLPLAYTENICIYKKSVFTLTNKTCYLDKNIKNVVKIDKMNVYMF